MDQKPIGSENLPFLPRATDFIQYQALQLELRELQIEFQKGADSDKEERFEKLTLHDQRIDSILESIASLPGQI